MKAFLQRDGASPLRSRRVPRAAATSAASWARTQDDRQRVGAVLRKPERDTDVDNREASLRIGDPGGVFEQEADRVAAQVLAMPAPLDTKAVPPDVKSAPPRIRPFAARSIGEPRSTPGSVVDALGSPGRPLEATLCRDMEQRFGHDFSQVRVHEGERAERSVQDIDAHAYTAGSHIVFGAGRFEPQTSDGRRLLAHELTHVVQQSGARASATPAAVVQRTPKKPPEVDPRAAPGHRDPMVKEPKSGAPLIETTSEGTRSITWSWEVERPGTAASHGQPMRQQVYWATFAVDEHGVMTVSARMVSESGQFRAPEWTLRGKFKEALDTFRGKGIEVKAFDAEWSYMSRGEMSGNLESFHSNLKKSPGKLDEAARATPSGKVAVENGFSQVSTPDIGWERQPHLEGEGKGPQVRQVVRVRFAVPGAKLPAPTPTGGQGTQVPDPRPSVAAPRIAKDNPPPAPSKPPVVEQKPAVTPAPRPTPPSPAPPAPGAAKPSAQKPRPTIDLSGYPPDREGPIVGRLKDASTIRTATTVVTTAQTAVSLGTGKDISLLGAVEWHFSSSVSAAANELEAKYPDVGRLRNEANLDALAKAYGAAISQLNAPSNAYKGALILAALTVPEKDLGAHVKRIQQNFAKSGGGPGRWQDYLNAGTAYMEAIFQVQQRLGDSPWNLPDIAVNIEQRAAVLLRAGSEMEDLFWSMMRSGGAMVPLVYYALFDLLHVANVMNSLGGKLSGLASAIRSRAGSYQRLFDQLEKDLKQISKDTEALAMRYHLKVPKD